MLKKKQFLFVKEENFFYNLNKKNDDHMNSLTNNRENMRKAILSHN